MLLLPVVASNSKLSNSITVNTHKKPFVMSGFFIALNLYQPAVLLPQSQSAAAVRPAGGGRAAVALTQSRDVQAIVACACIRFAFAFKLANIFRRSCNMNLGAPCRIAML